MVQELTCPGASPDCIPPTLAREFVYGRDFLEPVTMIDWTAAGQKPAGVAEILHYLQDALGSIVALTNPAAQEVFPAAPGRVVERYTYDPYGRTVIEKCNQSTGLPVERLEASRFGNPFAWTGQRYDAGVKLYHFLHRSYSPRLGRWLQRDPLGYVDGVSLYEYVASAPTFWIDPLGLSQDSGTPTSQPSGPPRYCSGLRKVIEGLSKNLANDIKNYDPKSDTGGKKFDTSGRRTKPGGHCPRLKSRQNQLRKLIKRYQEKCESRGSPSLPEGIGAPADLPIGQPNVADERPTAEPVGPPVPDGEPAPERPGQGPAPVPPLVGPPPIPPVPPLVDPPLSRPAPPPGAVVETWSLRALISNLARAVASGAISPIVPFYIDTGRYADIPTSPWYQDIPPPRID